MSAVDRSAPTAATVGEVAVALVDCDVHPVAHSDEQLIEYAPERWRSTLFRQGRELPTNSGYYDPPDFAHARAMRYDAKPPTGGPPGSDPDFAFEQLIEGAGIDIGILQPIPFTERLPEADHARRVMTNDWLADVWLGAHNRHGRWRGSISVSPFDPTAGAREIERWAGHPSMVEVLMCPQTQVSFGDPWFDPIYEAAARHGLPVATHLMGLGPFERTPITPVGNQSNWHDFMAAWPLLFASHLMSLVFDGAFDRFPTLRVVFVEGAFTWAFPLLWRMDAYWRARRGDVPWVRRPPSEYVREHVRFTSQPLEDPEPASEYERYLDLVDAAELTLFSTDYPHWSYDAPRWASTRFPRAQRERVLHANAIELFGLPGALPTLPS